MNRSYRHPNFMNALMMHFSGALWLYLLLYFSGVLNMEQFGAVYSFATLAATLLATVTSPYLLSRQWADMDQQPTAPRPPRIRFYAIMAAGWFLILWLGFRVMEWISVGLTGSARWPVSNVVAVLVIAAVATAAAVLLGLMHLRYYRKLSRRPS